MLHVRVFAPPDRSTEALDALRSLDGVHNLVHMVGVEVEHGDDLITGMVEPTAANDVVERLRALQIDRPGAVALIHQDRIDVRSDEDEAAESGSWDRSADALIVEEVVDEAKENARLSLNYLISMAVAGIIAGIGVSQDQPILIVGAMAISPDLLPLTAICVGVVARDRRTSWIGLRTLLSGLGVASIGAGIVVELADLAGLVHADASSVLTTFVTDPSFAVAIVALSAGVAAMLAIERHTSSAVGVAISVTTIPAAAAIGVMLGLEDWDRMVGAAFVLAINLVCLTVSGTLTLLIQGRGGGRFLRRTASVTPAPPQRSTRPPTRQ